MRQFELFKPVRTFGVPSEELTEPLFWIKELRFLRHLSPSRDAEVRRVTFHKGLNIIWAEASTEEEANPEQRVAGHAAGKTTLCRFIRFVLGERHCADGDVPNAIFHAFPGGHIVAEVFVRGERWIVCRPVNSALSSKCASDCSIDDFLAAPDDGDAYRIFMARMESLCADITPVTQLPDDSRLTFWHVLPWFTRDQDCYFADLAVWRNNPVTGAESPYLSKDKAMLVIRSVLAKEAAKEIPLVREQGRLTDEKKGIESKQHDAETVLGVFRGGLDGVAKAYECDIEFIDAKLEQIEKELSTTVEGDGVTEEEEARLAEIEDECAGLERECAVLKEQVEGCEGAYRHAIHKINELKKTAFRTEAASEIEEAAHEHPGRKYCCVPLEVAEKGCPIFKQARADIESQSNLFQATEANALEKMEEMAARHLEILEQERSRWNTRQTDLAGAVMRRDSVKRELRNKRRKHGRRAAECGGQLEVIRRYNAAKALRASLAETYLETKKSHDECSDSISKKRKLNKAKFNRFVDVFNLLIGFVLGERVSGEVSFNGGDILLSCAYKGNLTSTAIRMVQNVCFDLAVLVLSVEGGGTHPRFLLHDSPRVADLSADIFHRYFWLARKLEDLSNGEPSFQYIITTTEPPPKEMAEEGNPWLVCKLDARTAEHRLLKLDL